MKIRQIEISRNEWNDLVEDIHSGKYSDIVLQAPWRGPDKPKYKEAPEAFGSILQYHNGHEWSPVEFIDMDQRFKHHGMKAINE